MKQIRTKAASVAKQVVSNQDAPWAIALAGSTGITLAFLIFALDKVLGAASGADSAGIVQAALGAIIAIAAFHWFKRQ
jgi:hypothetical protein